MKRVMSRLTYLAGQSFVNDFIFHSRVLLYFSFLALEWTILKNPLPTATREETSPYIIITVGTG